MRPSTCQIGHGVDAACRGVHLVSLAQEAIHGFLANTRGGPGDDDDTLGLFFHCYKVTTRDKFVNV